MLKSTTKKSLLNQFAREIILHLKVMLILCKCFYIYDVFGVESPFDYCAVYACYTHRWERLNLCTSRRPSASQICRHVMGNASSSSTGGTGGPEQSSWIDRDLTTTLGATLSERKHTALIITKETYFPSSIYWTSNKTCSSETYHFMIRSEE